MARKQRKTISREIYKIAVDLYENKHLNIKAIAQTLGLDRNTVRKISDSYERQEVYILSSEKRRITHQERKRVLSQADHTIFSTVACNNALTQNELRDSIAETISPCRSTISRKLKSIGITRKRLSLVPEERNTLEGIDASALYSAEVSRFSDHNIVFLDETGFNRHTTRRYGSSAINTRAHLFVPVNRGTNISLVCLIGCTGPIAYQYIDGPFNTNTFMNFLNDHMITYFAAHPMKILVIDNVRFHKSQAVFNILRDNNIMFRDIVPYSSELNPIEEFFFDVESKIFRP